MSALAVSPDSRWLAFCPLNVDTIFIYNLEQNQLALTFPDVLIPALAFSADGQLFFYHSKGNQINTIQVPGWQPLPPQVVPGIPPIDQICAIPQRYWLALLADEHLVVWNYQHHRIVWQYLLTQLPSPYNREK